MAWGWNGPLKMSTGKAFNKTKYYLAKVKEHPTSVGSFAASQIYLYFDRHEEALSEAARAIALDPNDPKGYLAMAWTMITTGKPEASVELVERAMRLNPSYPSHYVFALGMAYFAIGELERAAGVFEETLRRDANATVLAPPLAATYALLGRRQQARATLLVWKPEASQLVLQNLPYHFPFKWSPDGRKVMERLRDGLKIAGLPLETTVSSLVDRLRPGNLFERLHAARTLGFFGPAAEAAVPDLIAALADEEFEAIRKEAVITLGKIGPGAKAAVPALTAIQHERLMGYYALEALKEITGK